MIARVGSSTLIVGQAPVKGQDPDRPVTGRIAARIAGFMGVTEAEFVAAFDRTNLIREWPGKKVVIVEASGPSDLKAQLGKVDSGDAFPMHEARWGAGDLVDEVTTYERIVLLGGGVAGAFHLDCPGTVPYLRWVHMKVCGSDPEEPLPCAVLPHPSGLNRWWNEPRNVGEAQVFLRLLLRTTWEGAVWPVLY